jgi:hypothetical protein
MAQNTELQCTCGRVRLVVERAPIVCAECHCGSCRAAGAALQARLGAPPIQESNGGTRYMLYRKDRIRFVAGRDLLREFRLTPDAKTRRVVAGCCNTPVFLELKGGHWLSLYRCLWGAQTPPLEVRTMTRDRPDGIALPDDVPNLQGHGGGFFVKLLGAWIAMGFRAPKIFVQGALDA